MKEITVIAFDLETIPDRSMVNLLPEPEVNKTLKDPVKVAADYESKKAAQLDMMGLDPMTNVICCAGWCDGERSGSIMLKDESKESIKTLLESFWEKVSGYNHFVSFNGRAFDMRCLLLHGMKHGIRPSVDIDAGKYNRGNHSDMRPILSGEGPFAKGKLDFFAKAFLGDHKTEGIDGKMVWDYWQMGAYDLISKYCEHDTELTFRLFEMARIAGLVNI